MIGGVAWHRACRNDIAASWLNDSPSLPHCLHLFALFTRRASSRPCVPCCIPTSALPS